MKITIIVDGKISVKRFRKIEKYLSTNYKGGAGRITRNSGEESPIQQYNHVVIEYSINDLDKEKAKKSMEGLADVLFAKNE